MDHARLPSSEVFRLISRSHRMHFEENRGHSKHSRDDYACRHVKSKNHKLEKTNSKKEICKEHKRKTKKVCKKCIVEDYSSKISDYSSICDRSNGYSNSSGHSSIHDRSNGHSNISGHSSIHDRSNRHRNISDHSFIHDRSNRHRNIPDHSSIHDRSNKHSNISDNSFIHDGNNRHSNMSDHSSIHDGNNSHLYGLYHCETCNVTLNSQSTYNSHINGKKHLKSLKTKTPEAIVKPISSFAAEGQRKYPRAPKGVLRTRIKVRAKLQGVIEKQINVPCPGLNFVTEIQGIKEIKYYCFMCDKVRCRNRIVEHLTGFKHRMKFLKYIKPDIYKNLKNLPRHKIDKRLIKVLRYVESKEETGKIIVEKDILSTEPRRRHNEFRSFSDSLTSTSSRQLGSNQSTSRDKAVPSTSNHNSDVPFEEKYKINAVPDMSHSDFYCRVCYSHMNSLAMWEMHITGKRHITNLKKTPGAPPSKTKTIAVPNAKAFLLERLEVEEVCGPIVGLDKIQEIQIPELQTEQYQCFLCGACLTSIDIIQHLLTGKHRWKYLNHIDFPGRETVNCMGERAASILIEEMCSQVEATKGRGNPSVHVSKSALSQKYELNSQ